MDFVFKIGEKIKLKSNEIFIVKELIAEGVTSKV